MKYTFCLTHRGNWAPFFHFFSPQDDILQLVPEQTWPALGLHPQCQCVALRMEDTEWLVFMIFPEIAKFEQWGTLELRKLQSGWGSLEPMDIGPQLIGGWKSEKYYGFAICCDTWDFAEPWIASPVMWIWWKKRDGRMPWHITLTCLVPKWVRKKQVPLNFSGVLGTRWIRGVDLKCWRVSMISDMPIGHWMVPSLQGIWALFLVNHRFRWITPGRKTDVAVMGLLEDV